MTGKGLIFLCFCGWREKIRQEKKKEKRAERSQEKRKRKEKEKRNPIKITSDITKKIVKRRAGYRGRNRTVLDGTSGEILAGG